MLLSLFLVGTVWFWLLLAVATIFTAIWVARESFGKATLTLVGTLALLAFFGDFNVLHWVRLHAVAFAIYLVVYVAAGTVWSVIKWWRFMGNLRESYDEAKRQFLAQRNVRGTTIPANLKKEWQTSGSSQYARTHSSQSSHDPSTGAAPRARDYKGKIMSWMIYWPLSFIGTLFDDPIRKLAQAIFNAIQGAYQGISNRAFKGIEDDFRPEPEPGAGPGTPPRATNHEDDEADDHRLV